MPTTFRADLHCHTTFSDGSLTPKELIALAKERGLRGLSITDHDTIDAYETALPLADQAGIVLGSGVEFSAYHQGCSVHILGYDFCLDDVKLRAFCAAHTQRRKDRNCAILDKLRKKNMPIEEEELLQLAHSTVGRPHIAQLMLQKGYVASIQEAFRLYIGENKPCYAAGAVFSVEETLAIIHQAGGKAFIAHPHLNRRREVVFSLLHQNFDGVECYYARCTPEKERRWLKVAKKRGLLISGGSDFHGSMRPHIPLGASWVDEHHFFQIFQRVYSVSSKQSCISSNQSSISSSEK